MVNPVNALDCLSLSPLLFCVTEHGIACFHIYLCEQVCVHTGRNIYVDIDISVLLKLYY